MKGIHTKFHKNRASSFFCPALDSLKSPAHLITRSNDEEINVDIVAIIYQEGGCHRRTWLCYISYEMVIRQKISEFLYIRLLHSWRFDAKHGQVQDGCYQSAFE